MTLPIGFIVNRMTVVVKIITMYIENTTSTRINKRKTLFYRVSCNLPMIQRQKVIEKAILKVIHGILVQTLVAVCRM